MQRLNSSCLIATDHTVPVPTVTLILHRHYGTSRVRDHLWDTDARAARAAPTRSLARVRHILTPVNNVHGVHKTDDGHTAFGSNMTPFAIAAIGLWHSKPLIGMCLTAVVAAQADAG
jgi:hypothetical protein